MTEYDFPPLLAPGPELSPQERSRYARHLILAGFGELAQRRVRAAHVLVIGAGGLGSPILQYLAAAGIGRITVIDDDTVDESNLHRQVIHGASTLGVPKAESAAQRLADLAELVQVDAVVERLDPGNVADFVSRADVVLDGSDNFATRYLVADACEISGTPLVWGTLDRYRAQVSVFWSRPPEGFPPISLRDVYPHAPAPGTVPSCGEAGVLGALTGQVGSLMALQALWLITGAGRPLLGKLLLLDSRDASQRVLRVSSDPNRAPVTDLGEATAEAAACEPDNAGAVAEISPRELAAELHNPSLTLVDVREAGERAVATIEPSLWVPLGQVSTELRDPSSALSRAMAEADDVVIYCKMGGRSAQAAQMIAQHTDSTGPRVRSLAGGIDEWTTQVDPSLPRY